MTIIIIIIIVMTIITYSEQWAERNGADNKNASNRTNIDRIALSQKLLHMCIFAAHILFCVSLLQDLRSFRKKKDESLSECVCAGKPHETAPHPPGKRATGTAYVRKKQYKQTAESVRNPFIRYGCSIYIGLRYSAYPWELGNVDKK